MPLINLLKDFLHLVKAKLGLLFQVIAAFLLPIKPLIILVGLMILLDTVSGLIKARKTKESITSSKLSRAISKMLLYQISLITFYALDKFLLGEFMQLFVSIPLFLTKCVAVFLCTVELVSLNENIKAITGMNPFQLLKQYITRAKELKKDIKDITGGKDDEG